MRFTAGRLEMRYQYSNTIVYNNFPWPTPTEKQREKIELCSTEILEVRKRYSGWTLSDLYSPLGMPNDLQKAHEKLDHAVMDAYGYSKDTSEDEIVADLLNRYERLIEQEKPAQSEKPKRTRKKANHSN